MFKEAIIDGLWKQNPGTIQLLGLCPTLAITTSVINGLSLGIATMFVMIIANSSISPIRKFVPDEVRVPIFILVIAALGLFLASCGSTYYHVGTGVKMNKKCGKK